MLSLLPLKFQT